MKALAVVFGTVVLVVGAVILAGLVVNAWESYHV